MFVTTFELQVIDSTSQKENDCPEIALVTKK